MTANVDIANRALQYLGARTNMSSAEFSGLTSNEAIQCNLIMFELRDNLNRMAPWNCSKKTANLTYICSQPGTPENSSSGPNLWQPGMPPPQWSYEYQYPNDCLRPRKIIPQYTSLSGGTPIYPLGTVTGFSPIGWSGPALKFEVGQDQFVPLTSITPVGTGTGYAVNDYITLGTPSFSFVQNGITYTMPSGAPAVVQVTGVSGGGAVTSVSVVSQIPSEATPFGGSYFAVNGANTGIQSSTTGNGTGETFTSPVFGTAGQQRVIICNQELAICEYNTQVTDPNVMDTFFQDAWVAILGARLAFQLTGDKSLANQLIGITNNIITLARQADGNEGITVNDVSPDWLRTRGNFGGPNWEYTPNLSFDWGSFYSPY